MKIFLAGEGAPPWREALWWRDIDARLISFYFTTQKETIRKIAYAWDVNKCSARRYKVNANISCGESCVGSVGAQDIS